MGRFIGRLQPVEQKKPAGLFCPHCKKEYKTEAALTRHMKTEHSQALDNSEK